MNKKILGSFFQKISLIWIFCALAFSEEISDTFLCSLTLLQEVAICKSTYYLSIFFFLESVSN